MNVEHLFPPQAERPLQETLAPSSPLEKTEEKFSPEPGEPLFPLSRINGQTSFSTVLPRLKAAFEAMQEPGSDLLALLADNVTELQDIFAETLYAELRKLKVDFSIKVTLRLNESAQLTLVGEHPDKGIIAALLASFSEFSTVFAEIASQSAALRDLRNLSTIMRHAEASKSYAALVSLPGDNTYQVSLKGEMNHFYFTR